jgi:hypothetical protein
MDAARGWSDRGGKEEDLQGGGELIDFERLAEDRAGWLSASERDFIARSVEGREREEWERQEQLRTAEQLAAAQKRQVRWASIAAVVLLLATGTAFWQWLAAIEATEVAQKQALLAEERLAQAQTRESIRLMGLVRIRSRQVTP